MPPSTEDLKEFIKELAKKEDLKVSIQESGKSAATVGGTTLLYAILMGPAGIPIGAAAGAGIAYARSKPFKSLLEVISDMDPEAWEILTQKVMNVMKQVDAKDVAAFVALASNNSTVKKQVVQAIGECLQNELAGKICYR